MILKVTCKHGALTGWLIFPEQQGITQHWYQNAPSHACSLTDGSRGKIFVWKGTKTWYPLKIAPHLWTQGAHNDSWEVWKWSPSLGTVTRKHLTHDWGKILPWEIQELLQGSTNARRLFLNINYVFCFRLPPLSNYKISKKDKYFVKYFF